MGVCICIVFVLGVSAKPSPHCSAVRRGKAGTARGAARRPTPAGRPTGRLPAAGAPARRSPGCPRRGAPSPAAAAAAAGRGADPARRRLRGGPAAPPGGRQRQQQLCAPLRPPSPRQPRSDRPGRRGGLGSPRGPSSRGDTVPGAGWDGEQDTQELLGQHAESRREGNKTLQTSRNDSGAPRRAGSARVRPSALKQGEFSEESRANTHQHRGDRGEVSFVTRKLQSQYGNL